MPGKTREELVAEYLRKIASPESIVERIPAEVTQGSALESTGGFESANQPANEIVDAALSGLDKVQRDEPLRPDEASALEAIILPKERPVTFVQQGTFTLNDNLWGHFGQTSIRSRIEAAIPSIGRVELPDNQRIPFAGTGFIVGDGLMMTNRHVAELFAQGLGTKRLFFRPGESAAIDFKREYQSTESFSLTVEKVLMIHPYWDMAILKIKGLPPSVKPLTLAVNAPEELNGREVAVVGYPAKDLRNDSKVQEDIFKGVYNVKRLQPGLVRERKPCRSFGKTVSAMTHDCSTLGGNSGSVLIDTTNGDVVGLHFAGVYLEDNFAVPTFELARDSRVVDLGVKFRGSVPATTSWARFWSDADAQAASNPPATGETSDQQPGPLQSGPLQTGAPLASATFTIPLHLIVTLGTPVSGSVLQSVTVNGGPQVSTDSASNDIEKVPVIFPDLESREGYQNDFLDLDGGKKVPMPKLTAEGLGLAAKLDDGSPFLNYHKFTVVIHKTRRLALFTAANVDWRTEARTIDGKKPSRKALNGFTANEKEDWVTDPRIPQQHQLPDYFYVKDGGAFDRGHLVRRDDVAWGDSFEDMQMGNGDTFHTTNCSPQTAEFNQSKFSQFNWGALENMVQKQTNSERVCVLSGPVLDANDRFFHGLVKSGSKVSIQIPTRYWKIIVANESGKPAAFGFVLDQDLAEVDLHDEMAIPDIWKQFMRPISEIEEYLNGLATLGPIKDWDQFDQVQDQ